MFNTESPIEIYYWSHPDATIKEFIDYTKEQDRRKQEAENERYNNCIDWYKNLEGVLEAEAAATQEPTYPA